MSYNLFNFSFQIRCLRMDQDFSSLDLVVEIIFITVSVVHFKFLIFVTVIFIWSSLKDKPPWYAGLRYPLRKEGDT